MAYVDRFIFRFNSVSGKAVRIAIADNDYTGAAVERRLGGSPQLRCELSGNIHGMSLEIPAECKVDDEFAVLYTSDPTRFAVRLEVDNVVVWRGFVTPELYAAPWVDPPYDVQITATDGLGELKMKEWPAIGSRTLKEILDTVLGATGLALGIRIISAAANDIAAAADLLTGTTVNLDHMAGKSYYDVLDGLLGSLHCTISQRGGAWLLVRETDVTSLTSGGQVSDTSGNTYPVKSFGSSKTHDCWPVGRLTTEIVPAKSVVEVECPNHLASLIADPDMELNLWQTNGSWTGEDGGYYTLDLNEYISQVITVANASRDADPGFRIKVSSRHTTPFGVGIMRLTVMATGRDPRSGSDKTLYLKEVTTQGRTQMEWVTEESHFDDGLGLPKTLDHQDCKEFETDIFRLPTSFNPLKSITVKVTAGKSTVCVHSVHIECMSVYDKAVTRLVMDNGARGDESNSPLFADSFVGNKGNFLLTNSLRGVAGAIVRTWSSDAIPSVPYGEWLSKDMALSVATPRLRMSGRLFTVTSLPALFYSNKGLSYITEEWSLDLIEDEADISLISLPAAALSTVSVSVIVEDNDGRKGTVSGGEIVSPKTGDSSSGSGYLDWFIAESYEADGETKYRLKLNPKYDGMYAEGWVSAGGVSEQGGGGGITGYLKDLLDVNGSMMPVDGQALVWDSSLGDNGRWTSKNVSVDLTPFERTANKVTSISASSTDGQYPSARAVYNALSSDNIFKLLAGNSVNSKGLGAIQVAEVSGMPSTYGTILQWSNAPEYSPDNTSLSVWYNQLFGSTSGEALYYRNRVNGANWSDWKRLAFVDDLSGYLPLTGGTMSGNLNLGSSVLVFEGRAYLDIDSSYQPVWSTDGSNRYNIWHTGNDGSGSGLDADLLDGLQPSQLDVNTAKTLKGYDNRGVDNPPSWYMSNPGQASIFTEFAQTGGAISLPNYESRTTFTPWGDAGGGRPTQLSLSDSGAFFRTSASNSAWNSWREFAFIDSNVASATKLEVARSISISDSVSSHTGTGVAFDGTAPVVLPLPSTINATIIGTATGITETSIEDEEFAYQATPVHDIADGYRIDKIKGRTLAFNQLIKCDATYWPNGNGSVTFDGTTINIPVSSLGYTERRTSVQAVVSGHVYYSKMTVLQVTSGVRLSESDSSHFITASATGTFSSIKRANLTTAVSIVSWGSNGDTVKVKDVMLIDLTLMFGADNEPSTADEFESMFPETYYDYTAGELINNSAEAIETTGFNQWDEEWELGYWSNGEKVLSSNNLMSNNLIPVIPGEEYYIKAPGYVHIEGFDAAKQFIGLVVEWHSPNFTFTIPAGCSFVAFYFYEDNITTYANDVCINLSSDKNGTYEPYRANRLALGLNSIKVKGSNSNILEFNGLASAGSVYDEISGGHLTKNVGRLVLTGSENWGRDRYGSIYCFILPIPDSKNGSSDGENSLYTQKRTAGASDIPDKTLVIDGYTTTYNGIFLRDDTYSNVADFKAYLAQMYAAGTPLVVHYVLATPVTYELVSPVPLSGRIDGNGTMRVISDGPVAPFRGDITYGCNPGQMGADASSVKSYLDAMLEIKVVNGVPMLHTTLPFYSDSFVSAGGLSGTGGSGSGSALRDLSDVQLPEIITTGSALVYNGEKWVQSDAAFVPQTRTVNGLELSSNISLSLGDLSNVNTAGASNGQSLIYNGSEWIAGTPAGAKFFHGVCSTSSSSNTKVVDCPSFTSTDLVAGTAIAIVMYNRCDTTSTVTINVNGTGANTLLAGFANRKAWSAGELILAVYDGSGEWDMLPTWYYTYYYGGGGSGGGGGTGSTVVVTPSYTSGTTLATITVDGTGYAIKMPVSVSQTQLSTNGTAIGSISVGSTSTTLYAPAVTVTQVQTSGVEVARIKVGSANPVSIFAPSGSGGASGVQTVVGKTGDVTTAQIADALTNAGYKLTDTVVDTSSFLPLSAGSGNALTGDLYTRSILPTASNTYDLGSSSKYFNNNYMKRIYLADGVYIEYDSTNRCVYVHGAGIATDSFVSAGGVSNT